MPIVSTAKMTARQFLEIGQDPPGVRLELVNGEVAVSPSPTPEHSNVDTELRSLIHQHVKAHRLGKVFGDVDTIFGELDVRRPDIVFFSTKRLKLVTKKAFLGPPDLCVEIISPSSSSVDRVDKFEQYESGGVLHYWMIDPRDRSIEGYTLHRGRYELSGRGQGSATVTLPPFPALKIMLGQLWMVEPTPSVRRRRNGSK
jgi:Uma2 family endonuclease